MTKSLPPQTLWRSSARTLRLAAALGLVALLGAAPLAAAQATFAAGFVAEEVVQSNWNEAAGIKFGPNGRMFVWQRGGQVFSVENGVRSAPIIDIGPEVGAWRDYGMVGFVLHPNWYANGYIYLSYVVDRHQFLECQEPAAGTGAPECSQNYSPTVDEYYDATIGRVTRYTLVKPAGDPDFRNATTVDYDSRKVLLGRTASDGCPIMHLSHGIGEILFGTDGSLIVACGDGASANSLDVGSQVSTHWAQAIADGIIADAENNGAFRSQMLDSHSGKLLRIDPETGDGLASNPFYEPQDTRTSRSRTWALGVRNGFRIELRPGTGSHAIGDGDPGILYFGDVGWNDFEELNVVTAGGQNFGWPIYEGMEQFANGYPNTLRYNSSEPNPLFGQPNCTTSSDEFFSFQDLLLPDTLDPNPVWPNPCSPATPIPATVARFVHRRPLLEWDHDNGLPPRWSTYDGLDPVQPNLNVAAPDGSVVNGPLFPGNASVGGAWYTGDHYPTEFQNTYFHADYGAGWIKTMRLDENNLFLRGPDVAIDNFADNVGPVVDLAVSPTDGMLYYIEWPFRVYRVRYIGDGNFPPRALATSDVSYGPAPLTVQFSSDGTTDPENDPLDYLWDFGDGSQSTLPDPQHEYDPTGSVVGPETYPVTLTVTDDSGESDLETLSVSINNTPPFVMITSPQNLDTYSMAGATQFTMTANIADAEHSAGQLSCEWTVYLQHNFHNHSAPIDTSCSTSTVISPAGCTGESYFYRIVLRVSDAHGLIGEDEVSIFPDCGGLNAPPVAYDDSFVVTNGGMSILTVLDNDSDDVGLDLSSVNIVNPPTFGNITNIDTSTGEVTYTHNGSATSTDGFSYNVSDGENLSSNVANVTLNIVPADDDQPPTIPTDLRASVTGAQVVTARWDESVDVGGAGVAGYRVYRDGVEVGFTAERYWVDQALTLDTPYTYRVAAVDYVDNESAQSVAASVTTPAVAGLELRVNAGTTAYTDDLGNVWMLDQGYNIGTTGTTGVPILGTSNDALYSSQRFDNSGGPVDLGYTFPLPNGVYVVNLHFADITLFTAQVGRRIFDVALEGNTVLDDFDVFAEVGSYTATFESFLVPVVDGALNIDFYRDVRHPIIGAIEVIQFGEFVPSVTITDPTEGATVNGPDISVTYALSGDPAEYDGVRFTLDGGTPVEDATPDGQFDVSGLAAGGHTIVAELVDSGDVPLANPEASDTVSFSITLPDLVDPTVPSNFSATATGPTSADLSWDASTDSGGSGLGGYTIFRDGVPLTVVETTAFTDDTLAPATSYSYAVSAYDNAGNESALTSSVQVQTDPPPPTVTVDAPTPGAQIYGDQVTLVYSLAGDAGAYDHLHITLDGGTPLEDTALTGSVELTNLVTGTQSVTVELVDAAHVPLPNPEASASVGFEVLAPDTLAPPVPTGLTVLSTGTTQVQLDFDDVSDSGGSGLAGYRVYRDGALAGSPLDSAFTDSGLSADTTYTYTVSAIDNAGNESAQSAGVPATTGIPGIWEATDIGTVGAAGSFTNGSVMTVSGSGYDIWYYVDEFYFVYQPLIGDGVITTLVTSQTNTHPWAKAGVMIRDTLTAGSAHAGTFLTPSNGVTYVRRLGVGIYSQETVDPGPTAPYWLRVEREGDTFRGYRSIDGQSWDLIDSVDIPMTGEVYIGLAVSSVNDGVLSTATFENVTLGMDDNIAPAVPANLSGSATGTDTTTLSWDTSGDTGGSGLAGYRLYRDGALVIDSAATTFDDSGLAADTTYDYTVSAYDVAGNESAQSPVFQVTTDAPPDLTAPSVPANLNGSGTGSDSTTLSWDPSTDTGGSGVAGYRLYRNGALVIDTGATLFNDSGLAADTTYAYSISAYDFAGNESAQSPILEITTDAPPDLTAPSVPANLNGSATGTDSTTLNWDPSTDTGGSGLAGYRLYRDGALVIDTAATTFDDSGLAADTTYDYTVSAYDVAGNESAQSPVFQVTTDAPPDLTAPSVPANLNGSATGSDSTTLSWDPSTDMGGSGLAGYRLYRDGALVIDTAATTFDDSGLAADTTYDYTVSAYDVAGNESAQSPIFPVTTDAPPDLTAPSVPANLTGSATGTDSATLSWDPSGDTGGSGVAGYRLYRNGALVIDTGATLFNDSGLAADTTYAYSISAYDFAGNESAQSPILEITTDAPPDLTAPSVPANLNGSATGTDSTTLNWDPSTDTGGSGLAGYRLYRDGALVIDTAATTFDDSGLTADTTYEYTVSAYDVAGNESAQSPIFPVTTDAPPDLTAPSVPANLTGSATGTDSTTLSWDPSTDTGGSGLAGYRLYRDGALVIDTAATTFDDSGLAADTTYDYTVSAYDVAGNESAQSPIFPVTTDAPPDLTAPSVPANLTGSATGTDSTTLNWDPSTDTGGSGLAGYRLYRDGALVIDTAATTFDDSGLAADTTYDYTVSAYDVAGNESAQSPIFPVTTDAPPDLTAPSVPANLSGSATGTDSATLNWDPSTDTGGSGLAGYRLYRDGALVIDTAATTFDDSGLAADTTYDYTVSAYDVAGNESAQSPIFPVTTDAPPDLTAPSVPANLTGSATGTDSTTLSWDPSTDTGGSGLAGYRLYRDGALVIDTAATTFDDSGLAADTTYDYTVSAYDVAGNESAQSPIFPVTTDAPPDLTAPSVPANLNGSATGSDSATLNWDPSTDTGGSGVAGYRLYRDGALVIDTAATTFDDSGLAADTTYDYTVSAYDVAGNESAQSPIFPVTTDAPPDLTAPSVPANLTGSATGTDSATLSWDPSGDTGGSGVAGYRLYRNGALVIDTGATLFNDSGLAADTTYAYSISAYDFAGNESAQSPIFPVTTDAPPDLTAPSVPANLNGSATGSDSATLNWDPSTDTGGSGVAGYRLYRDGALVIDTAATTFDDSGLAADTTYDYTVSAYDVAGNESAQSPIFPVTTDAPPDLTAPSVPANLTGSATGTDSATLSWDPSGDTGGSGVAGYRLYRDGALVIDTAATTFDDSGLTADTTYDYTVSAYDVAGNESAQSPIFPVTTDAPPDLTAPSVPANLTGSATGTDSTTLNWDPSTDTGGSGLAGYRLYRDGALVIDTAATTFDDSGLTADTTYDYTVSAYDVAGNESAQSPIFPVTTDAPPDSDADGIIDAVDNCIMVSNAAQIDADADGFGNACDGDFNNDNIVNSQDLGLMKLAFFSNDPVVDLNSDGVVNPIDLGIMRGLIFLPPGPSGLVN